MFLNSNDQWELFVICINNNHKRMFWAFSNPCVKILHGLHVSTQQYKFHHPKCSTFIVHAKQTKQVCVLDHQMQTCELICIFLFSLHGKVQFDF
jgi:hypothetical protein